MTGEPKETIMVVRGEVTPEDRDFALRILGMLGLSTEFVDQERIVKLRGDLLVEEESSNYTLEEITSREQYLGRDHVVAFRRNYAADFTERIGTMSFLHLIRPAARWSLEQQKYESNPEEYGLIVASREDLGWGRLGKGYAPSPVTGRLHHEAGEHAVQVGSALDFVDRINTDLAVRNQLDNFGTTQQNFLNRLAKHLQVQIKE